MHRYQELLLLAEHPLMLSEVITNLMHMVEGSTTRIAREVMDHYHRAYLEVNSVILKTLFLFVMLDRLT